jgi:peptide deformylase
MAEREIVTVPHPSLRRKAREVKDFGPELQTLIDDMVETMRVAPGVGLAAPQIDVPLRVITVEFGDEEDEEKPTKLYMVVNPTIKRFSKDTVMGVEGCLSIPGFAGEIERAQAVTVKGYNRHGQQMTIKAKGWLARIFQHEIDHLDGILFTDNAERVWQLQPEGEEDPTESQAEYNLG